MGDLVMVNGLSDCGRCGDQPVFVGTMTVGDIVMVTGLCL